MLFGPTGNGRKTVFTVHDLAWRDARDARSARSTRLHERMWKRVVASDATVITSTEAGARVLVDSGLGTDRCFVVPLGVGPRENSAVSETLVPTAPYLLSVSTLEPRKNLPGLIDGFRISRLWDEGFELVVVGPDGWELDVAALIDRQPAEVARRVRVLGFVSSADLGGLYRSASAAAYPSFSEGFGLPVLEAMSWGTPVVTSEGASTAEVAGGAAVLVDPADPSDIAAGLMAAVDRDDREAFAAAGRARAEELSWDRHIDRTVDLYRTVLGDGE